MSIQLTKEEDAMVRAMAGSMNGSEQENFVAAVIARLEGVAAQGVTITRNNVRAAATAELSK